MINLKPELVAQLERVLSSVEMLLPKATKAVDWKNLLCRQLAASFFFRLS